MLRPTPDKGSQHLPGRSGPNNWWQYLAALFVVERIFSTVSAYLNPNPDPNFYSLITSGKPSEIYFSS